MTEVSVQMVYLKFPVTPVTAVTEYGVVVLASTGSVDTDPLVRECPDTPGGDAVDP